MGSSYDASKKNASNKAKETDPKNALTTAIESAEHMSPDSAPNYLAPNAFQANASFTAQELLGNQQVADRQLTSTQASSSALTAEADVALHQTPERGQARVPSHAPSLENEEFWGQLFGGDPAPTEPNTNVKTYTSEQRSIPWLSGWTKSSTNEKNDESDSSNIGQNGAPAHRDVALNRWAPEELFNAKDPFTLDTTINLKWYHPICQAIKASRFIAAHSTSPSCQKLSAITGPFSTLSSTSSLISDSVDRTLAIQTAISLSLASSSIEIACNSYGSSSPDIAASIILCAPLVKPLHVARSIEHKNSDSQAMFKGEIEELNTAFPRISMQASGSDNDPSEHHVSDNLTIVTAALREVIGLQHIPDINNPFNPLETDNDHSKPSGPVAELDALLSGSAANTKSQYKIGALITEALSFTRIVSSMRFAYTRMAAAIWLACGPAKYDALYDSLKSAMPPIKAIARATQVHLHLIEINIKDDIDTAKSHYRALAELPEDLRRALREQTERLAAIAVTNPSRSYDEMFDPKKEDVLLKTIASIEKGNMIAGLGNLDSQPFESEAPGEQELLLSTLRLAILFGNSDKSTIRRASLATAEMAKLNNARFHSHFAKIVGRLIR